VEKGNTLAIVGKSGSGKTTLLNCLGGLERPDSGRIICFDTEITALDQLQMTRFRRQHLGFMFQAGNLISSLTVFENIAFPLHLNHCGKKERSRRVNQLLEALSLDGLSRSMPHELSGGQAQRVAFARAVSHVPALLLADEPTASLDSTTALNLIRLMADTGRALGVTIIVSTHDNDIIRLSDRTIRLMDGKAKEENHETTG
jgi:putative ABC transport system ATP-binding protein